MLTLNPLNSFKTSFRFRVITIALTVMTLMTISFTAVSIYKEIKTHKLDLLKDGKILAELLAYNARLGLFSENETLLQGPVDGILRQEDVSSVAIFTLEGKLLKSKQSSSERAGKVADKIEAGAVKRALALVEQSRSFYYSESSSLFEVWAPVVSGLTAYAGEGPLLTEEAPLLEGEYFLSNPSAQRKERLIGFVKIALDKSNLKKQITVTLYRNGLIGGIFMLLGVMITYSILNRVLKPLKTLTTAVTRLGEEGSAQILPVDTADEIGRLADSFNQMLEALKKREAEKQKIEAQLRQAQKMEAVGQLAGGIAHDFNNILTAIISYGNVLQMKMQAEDPLRRNVERILSASERASVLTKGMLAFSRQQPVSLQPVNLNATIKNVEKLLKKFITEEIEFRTKFTAKEPVLMGDSGQIEQILMNLVTNARDAMPEGGLLTIETEVIELDEAFVAAHGKGEPGDPGEYVLLSVTDSGLGMEADTITRIFEPFFTTKETGKGTGLGLAMAYGIIKQHKGIIDVYSQQGMGTTLRIYFPLIRSAVAAKELLAPQPPTGGAETILLAEDDEDVRDVTKSIFEDFGYTVIAAADGEAAINAFRQNRDRITLLITDVIMPLKNGREVYRKISEEKPGIKALFTSGYTADIITKKGLLEGGMPFISKPVSPTVLLKKVREVLDK